MSVRHAAALTCAFIAACGSTAAPPGTSKEPLLGAVSAGACSASPFPAYFPSAGCECKPTWSYNGITTCDSQCAAPDQDPNGPWCFTTATCNGTTWAYCHPSATPPGPLPPAPTCTPTEFPAYAPPTGCTCQETWSANGITTCNAQCALPYGNAKRPWCDTTAPCDGQSWAYCRVACSPQSLGTDSAALRATGVCTGCALCSAQLSNVSLTLARLSGSNLTAANLSRASLVGALMDDVDLSQANLAGANLTSANLSESTLSGADLTGATLSGAKLAGAVLAGAKLAGANVSGASLQNANLTGADLSSANLSSADLSGAILTGANLSGASLGLARWPDGRACDPGSVGACNVRDRDQLCASALSGYQGTWVYYAKNGVNANCGGDDRDDCSTLRCTNTEWSTYCTNYNCPAGYVCTVGSKRITGPTIYPYCNCMDVPNFPFKVPDGAACADRTGICRSGACVR